MLGPQSLFTKGLRRPLNNLRAYTRECHGKFMINQMVLRGIA